MPGRWRYRKDNALEKLYTNSDCRSQNETKPSLVDSHKKNEVFSEKTD